MVRPMYHLVVPGGISPTVTTLDLLLHRILYSFVLLSRALYSFTSNLATIILLDLQIKMHLLILEFVALYIYGV